MAGGTLLLSSSSSSSTSYLMGSLLFWILILLSFSGGSYGYGTFGFDIHHRYSDPVKGILALDDLPVKGSRQYYAAMAHRDRVTRGRGLLEANDSTPLTFLYGNETYRLSGLGFLHYANVSIGSPGLSFLVALDTGSDLFWLPCDCTSCIHGLKSSAGQTVEFNIYSPNTSKTSDNVPCDSNLCSLHNKCSSASSDCPYIVQYLSNGTSSSGVLVEDYLHLTSDNTQMKAIDAKITFGCGKIQTGSFLDGAAPNGLFGLGMTNISVPSTLAREGHISNSFSMCFGPDGRGRISFGDKGSLDQGETPFNLRQSHPTYNISITQISVGKNPANLAFNAIFDSGTSFTYLNDPAYSLITQNFNNLVKESRHRSSSSDLPFEYCYDIGSNQTELEIPDLVLTFLGGDAFNVTDPIVLVQLQSNAFMYCLGVVKSGNVNIIGQNFMTGYRIVFDRKREILGWKASDCYDGVETSTLPISPAPSAVPPATAVGTQATSGSTNTNHNSGGTSTTGNYSPHLNPLTCTLLLIFLTQLFALV